MAQFRILNARRSTTGYVEFIVEWLDGKLSRGDVFHVFETHHRVPVTVTEVVPRPAGALLKCDLDSF